MLSCVEVSAFHVAQQPGVDLVDMAAVQLTDLELQYLKNGTTGRSTSLVLKAVPLPWLTLALYCNVSTGTRRPFVPTAMRRSVF